NPGNLSATSEKILEASLNFGTGIVRRKDLNCQIGSTGEKFAGRGLKAQFLETPLWNEGNIRRAAVAALHPEASAGIEHNAKPVFDCVVVQGSRQSHADTAVIKVVFRAQDQFPVNQFVLVPIIRQRLQLRLGPVFLLNTCN